MTISQDDLADFVFSCFMFRQDGITTILESNIQFYKAQNATETQWFGLTDVMTELQIERLIRKLQEYLGNDYNVEYNGSIFIKW